MVLARSAHRVGAVIFCQYKRGARARPRRLRGVVLDECDDLARLSTAEGRGKARNVADRVFLSFHVAVRNETDLDAITAISAPRAPRRPVAVRRAVRRVGGSAAPQTAVIITSHT